MEEIKKAYDEVFDALYKYKDLCNFNLSELERTSKYHLFGVELKEKYGLNIDPKKVSSLNYQKFGDKGIGLFGEKYGRTISWSVDGRQPNDEYLFTISFPTGTYIFGQDNPKEFFLKFWLELKSYKPDYEDEVNHCLYWKLENAKDVFNNYESILERYNALNIEDVKQRKINSLKAELDKLTKK